MGISYKGEVRIGVKSTGLGAKSINGVIEEILGQRAKSVTQMPDLRKDIGRVYIQAVTPYVPKMTGRLRNSAFASNDGRVTWSAVNSQTGENYAYDQYTNTRYRHKVINGVQTQAWWTNAVMPDEPGWEDFIEQITPMIKERFENG